MDLNKVIITGYLANEHSFKEIEKGDKKQKY